MRIKSILLGLFAIACAVGSAFATKSLAPVDAWIRANTTGGTAFTCLATTKQCSNSGTANCRIEIQLQNGNTDFTNGRTPTECVILKNINDTPISAVLKSGAIPTSVDPYIP